MYVDKQLLLSANQDLSQTAGTYVSENLIDLGVAAKRDLGAGKPVAVVICVDEAFASAGAATVVFSLLTNNEEDLTTTPTTLYSTPAIAYTELTLGKVIALPFPQGRSTQRYVGVSYTIAGATTTAGTCSAFIAFDW
jgi:hypothetical protein